MKISTARLQYLLHNGYDEEETILVHGTSIEAIEIMIKTGYLPNNKTEMNSISHTQQDKKSSTALQINIHPVEQGYLYFAPIYDAFKNHPLYNQLSNTCTFSWAEKEAAGYAQIIQREQIGFQYCGAYLSIEELLRDESKRDNPRISPDIIKKIPWNNPQFQKSISTAKGVLIGLSRKIYELTLEQGSDIPDKEVMIYLPQGLHHSYLHYILPLGKTEEKKLQKLYPLK